MDDIATPPGDAPEVVVEVNAEPTPEPVIEAPVATGGELPTLVDLASRIGSLEARMDAAEPAVETAEIIAGEAMASADAAEAVAEAAEAHAIEAVVESVPEAEAPTESEGEIEGEIEGEGGAPADEVVPDVPELPKVDIPEGPKRSSWNFWQNR
jgi:hypothetical protein